MAEKRMNARFLCENLGVRLNFLNMEVDWNISLKWIFKK
jgi:hypothetical protein